MKTLFKLGMLVTALIALFTAEVQAQYSQVYGAQPLTLWTNKVTASAAVAFTNTVIDCHAQRNVSLQITHAVDSTGATITYAFQTSVDGTSWSTARAAIALADPGVTGTTVVTNIDTLGYGYLRLSYITNNHATAVLTNTAIVYGLKIGAP